MHMIYHSAFKGEKNVKGKSIIHYTVRRLISVIISVAVTVFFLCPFLFSVNAADNGDVDTVDIREMIRTAFYSFAETVDVSEYGIDKNEIGDIFISVTKNDPYLFFVDNRLSFSYRKDGTVVSIKPNYIMTRIEAESAIEYCKGEIARIASLVPIGYGEEDIALFVHDYICIHYKYDLSLESDNMYTFLSSFVGTCQGYTWTYMAVLRELGMKSVYAASDTIGHIWNLVEIDGQWYHVDVTWDDPPQSEGSGETSHRHFLMSDGKAIENGHRDFYSDDGIVCTSSKYDGLDSGELADQYIYVGDVDHDGDVGLYDIILSDAVLSGQETNTVCRICGDIDFDSVFDDADIGSMRKKLLEKALP